MEKESNQNIVDKQFKNNYTVVESSTDSAHGVSNIVETGGGIDQNYNIANQSLNMDSPLDTEPNVTSNDKSSTLVMHAGRDTAMNDYLGNQMGTPLPELNTISTAYEDDGEVRNDNAPRKIDAIYTDCNQQDDENNQTSLLPPSGFEDASSSNSSTAHDNFPESEGCTGFSDVEFVDHPIRTSSVVEILAAIALGPMLAVPAADEAPLSPTELITLIELKELALTEIKSRSIEIFPHSLSVIPEESGEIYVKNFSTPDEIEDDLNHIVGTGSNSNAEVDTYFTDLTENSLVAFEVPESVDNKTATDLVDFRATSAVANLPSSRLSIAKTDDGTTSKEPLAESVEPDGAESFQPSQQSTPLLEEVLTTIQAEAQEKTIQTVVQTHTEALLHQQLMNHTDELTYIAEVSVESLKNELPVQDNRHTLVLTSTAKIGTEILSSEPIQTSADKAAELLDVLPVEFPISTETFTLLGTAVSSDPSLADNVAEEGTVIVPLSSEFSPADVVAYKSDTITETYLIEASEFSTPQIPELQETVLSGKVDALTKSNGDANASFKSSDGVNRSIMVNISESVVETETSVESINTTKVASETQTVIETIPTDMFEIIVSHKTLDTTDTPVQFVIIKDATRIETMTGAVVEAEQHSELDSGKEIIPMEVTHAPVQHCTPTDQTLELGTTKDVAETAEKTIDTPAQHSELETFKEPISVEIEYVVQPTPIESDITSEQHVEVEAAPMESMPTSHTPESVMVAGSSEEPSLKKEQPPSELEILKEPIYVEIEPEYVVQQTPIELATTSERPAELELAPLDAMPTATIPESVMVNRGAEESSIKTAQPLSELESLNDPLSVEIEPEYVVQSSPLKSVITSERPAEVELAPIDAMPTATISESVMVTRASEESSIKTEQPLSELESLKDSLSVEIEPESVVQSSPLKSVITSEQPAEAASIEPIPTATTLESVMVTGAAMPTATISESVMVTRASEESSIKTEQPLSELESLKDSLSVEIEPESVVQSSPLKSVITSEQPAEAASIEPIPTATTLESVMVTGAAMPTATISESVMVTRASEESSIKTEQPLSELESLKDSLSVEIEPESVVQSSPLKSVITSEQPAEAASIEPIPTATTLESVMVTGAAEKSSLKTELPPSEIETLKDQLSVEIEPEFVFQPILIESAITLEQPAEAAPIELIPAADTPESVVVAGASAESSLKTEQIPLELETLKEPLSVKIESDSVVHPTPRESTNISEQTDEVEAVPVELIPTAATPASVMVTGPSEDFHQETEQSPSELETLKEPISVAIESDSVVQPTPRESSRISEQTEEIEAVSVEFIPTAAIVESIVETSQETFSKTEQPLSALDTIKEPLEVEIEHESDVPSTPLDPPTTSEQPAEEEASPTELIPAANTPESVVEAPEELSQNTEQPPSELETLNEPISMGFKPKSVVQPTPIKSVITLEQPAEVEAAPIETIHAAAVPESVCVTGPSEEISPKAEQPHSQLETLKELLSVEIESDSVVQPTRTESTIISEQTDEVEAVPVELIPTAATPESVMVIGPSEDLHQETEQSPSELETLKEPISVAIESDSVVQPTPRESSRISEQTEEIEAVSVEFIPTAAIVESIVETSQETFSKTEQPLSALDTIKEPLKVEIEHESDVPSTPLDPPTTSEQPAEEEASPTELIPAANTPESVVEAPEELSQNTEQPPSELETLNEPISMGFKPKSVVQPTPIKSVITLEQPAEVEAAPIETIHAAAVPESVCVTGPSEEISPKAEQPHSQLETLKELLSVEIESDSVVQPTRTESTIISEQTDEVEAVPVELIPTAATPESVMVIGPSEDLHQETEQSPSELETLKEPISVAIESDSVVQPTPRESSHISEQTEEIEAVSVEFIPTAAIVESIVETSQETFSKTEQPPSALDTIEEPLEVKIEHESNVLSTPLDPATTSEQPAEEEASPTELIPAADTPESVVDAAVSTSEELYQNTEQPPSELETLNEPLSTVFKPESVVQPNPIKSVITSEQPAEVEAAPIKTIPAAAVPESVGVTGPSEELSPKAEQPPSELETLKEPVSLGIEYDSVVHPTRTESTNISEQTEEVETVKVELKPATATPESVMVIGLSEELFQKTEQPPSKLDSTKESLEVQIELKSNVQLTALDPAITLEQPAQIETALIESIPTTATSESVVVTGTSEKSSLKTEQPQIPAADTPESVVVSGASEKSSLKTEQPPSELETIKEALSVEVEAEATVQPTPRESAINSEQTEEVDAAIINSIPAVATRVKAAPIESILSTATSESVVLTGASDLYPKIEQASLELEAHKEPISVEIEPDSTNISDHTWDVEAVPVELLPAVDTPESIVVTRASQETTGSIKVAPKVEIAPESNVQSTPLDPAIISEQPAQVEAAPMKSILATATSESVVVTGASEELFPKIEETPLEFDSLKEPIAVESEAGSVMQPTPRESTNISEPPVQVEPAPIESIHATATFESVVVTGASEELYPKIEPGTAVQLIPRESTNISEQNEEVEAVPVELIPAAATSESVMVTGPCELLLKKTEQPSSELETLKELISVDIEADSLVQPTPRKSTNTSEQIEDVEAVRIELLPAVATPESVVGTSQETSPKTEQPPLALDTIKDPLEVEIEYESAVPSTPLHPATTSEQPAQVEAALIESILATETSETVVETGASEESPKIEQTPLELETLNEPLLAEIEPESVVQPTPIESAITSEQPAQVEVARIESIPAAYSPQSVVVTGAAEESSLETEQPPSELETRNEPLSVVQPTPMELAITSEQPAEVKSAPIESIYAPPTNESVVVTRPSVKTEQPQLSSQLETLKEPLSVEIGPESVVQPPPRESAITSEQIEEIEAAPIEPITAAAKSELIVVNGALEESSVTKEQPKPPSELETLKEPLSLEIEPESVVQPTPLESAITSEQSAEIEAAPIESIPVADTPESVVVTGASEKSSLKTEEPQQLSELENMKESLSVEVEPASLGQPTPVESDITSGQPVEDEAAPIESIPAADTPDSVVVTGDSEESSSKTEQPPSELETPDSVVVTGDSEESSSKTEQPASELETVIQPLSEEIVSESVVQPAPTEPAVVFEVVNASDTAESVEVTGASEKSSLKTEQPQLRSELGTLKEPLVVEPESAAPPTPIKSAITTEQPPEVPPTPINIEPVAVQPTTRESAITSEQIEEIKAAPIEPITAAATSELIVVTRALEESSVTTEQPQSPSELEILKVKIEPDSVVQPTPLESAITSGQPAEDEGAKIASITVADTPDSVVVTGASEKSSLKTEQPQLRSELETLKEPLLVEPESAVPPTPIKSAITTEQPPEVPPTPINIEPVAVQPTTRESAITSEQIEEIKAAPITVAATSELIVVTGSLEESSVTKEQPKPPSELETLKEPLSLEIEPESVVQPTPLESAITSEKSAEVEAAPIESIPVADTPDSVVVTGASEKSSLKAKQPQPPSELETIKESLSVEIEPESLVHPTPLELAITLGQAAEDEAAPIESIPAADTPESVVTGASEKASLKTEQPPSELEILKEALSEQTEEVEAALIESISTVATPDSVVPTRASEESSSKTEHPPFQFETIIEPLSVEIVPASGVQPASIYPAFATEQPPEVEVAQIESIVFEVVNVADTPESVVVTGASEKSSLKTEQPQLPSELETLKEPLSVDIEPESVPPPTPIKSAVTREEPPEVEPAPIEIESAAVQPTPRESDITSERIEEIEAVPMEPIPAAATSELIVVIGALEESAVTTEQPQPPSELETLKDPLSLDIEPESVVQPTPLESAITSEQSAEVEAAPIESTPVADTTESVVVTEASEKSSLKTEQPQPPSELETLKKSLSVEVEPESLVQPTPLESAITSGQPVEAAPIELIPAADTPESVVITEASEKSSLKTEQPPSELETLKQTSSEQTEEVEAALIESIPAVATPESVVVTRALEESSSKTEEPPSELETIIEPLSVEIVRESAPIEPAVATDQPTEVEATPREIESAVLEVVNAADTHEASEKLHLKTEQPQLPSELETLKEPLSVDIEPESVVTPTPIKSALTTEQPPEVEPAPIEIEPVVSEVVTIIEETRNYVAVPERKFLVSEKTTEQLLVTIKEAIPSEVVVPVASENSTVIIRHSSGLEIVKETILKKAATSVGEPLPLEKQADIRDQLTEIVTDADQYTLGCNPGSTTVKFSSEEKSERLIIEVPERKEETERRKNVISAELPFPMETRCTEVHLPFRSISFDSDLEAFCTPPSEVSVEYITAKESPESGILEVDENIFCGSNESTTKFDPSTESLETPHFVELTHELGKNIVTKSNSSDMQSSLVIIFSEHSKEPEQDPNFTESKGNSVPMVIPPPPAFSNEIETVMPSQTVQNSDAELIFETAGLHSAKAPVIFHKSSNRVNESLSAAEQLRGEKTVSVPNPERMVAHQNIVCTFSSVSTGGTSVPDDAEMKIATLESVSKEEAPTSEEIMPPVSSVEGSKELPIPISNDPITENIYPVLIDVETTAATTLELTVFNTVPPVKTPQPLAGNGTVNTGCIQSIPLTVESHSTDVTQEIQNLPSAPEINNNVYTESTAECVDILDASLTTEENYPPLLRPTEETTIDIQEKNPSILENDTQKPNIECIVKTAKTVDEAFTKPEPELECPSTTTFPADVSVEAPTSEETIPQVSFVDSSVKLPVPKSEDYITENISPDVKTAVIITELSVLNPIPAVETPQLSEENVAQNETVNTGCIQLIPQTVESHSTDGTQEITTKPSTSQIYINIPAKPTAECVDVLDEATYPPSQRATQKTTMDIQENIPSHKSVVHNSDEANILNAAIVVCKKPVTEAIFPTTISDIKNDDNFSDSTTESDHRPELTPIVESVNQKPNIECIVKTATVVDHVSTKPEPELACPTTKTAEVSNVVAPTSEDTIPQVSFVEVSVSKPEDFRTKNISPIDVDVEPTVIVIPSLELSVLNYMPAVETPQPSEENLAENATANTGCIQLIPLTYESHSTDVTQEQTTKPSTPEISINISAKPTAECVDGLDVSVKHALPRTKYSDTATKVLVESNSDSNVYLLVHSSINSGEKSSQDPLLQSVKTSTEPVLLTEIETTPAEKSVDFALVQDIQIISKPEGDTAYISNVAVPDGLLLSTKLHAITINTDIACNHGIELVSDTDMVRVEEIREESYTDVPAKTETTGLFTKTSPPKVSAGPEAVTATVEITTEEAIIERDATSSIVGNVAAASSHALEVQAASIFESGAATIVFVECNSNNNLALMLHSSTNPGEEHLQNSPLQSVDTIAEPEVLTASSAEKSVDFLLVQDNEIILQPVGETADKLILPEKISNVAENSYVAHGFDLDSTESNTEIRRGIETAHEISSDSDVVTELDVPTDCPVTTETGKSPGDITSDPISMPGSEEIGRVKSNPASIVIETLAGKSNTMPEARLTFGYKETSVTEIISMSDRNSPLADCQNPSMSILVPTSDVLPIPVEVSKSLQQSSCSVISKSFDSDTSVVIPDPTPECFTSKEVSALFIISGTKSSNPDFSNHVTTAEGEMTPTLIESPYAAMDITSDIYAESEAATTGDLPKSLSLAEELAAAMHTIPSDIIPKQKKMENSEQFMESTYTAIQTSLEWSYELSQAANDESPEMTSISKEVPEKVMVPEILPVKESAEPTANPTSMHVVWETYSEEQSLAAKLLPETDGINLATIESAPVLTLAMSQSIKESVAPDSDKISTNLSIELISPLVEIAPSEVPQAESPLIRSTILHQGATESQVEVTEPHPMEKSATHQDVPVDVLTEERLKKSNLQASQDSSSADTEASAIEILEIGQLTPNPSVESSPSEFPTSDDNASEPIVGQAASTDSHDESLSTINQSNKSTIALEITPDRRIENNLPGITHATGTLTEPNITVDLVIESVSPETILGETTASTAFPYVSKLVIDSSKTPVAPSSSEPDITTEQSVAQLSSISVRVNSEPFTESQAQATVSTVLFSESLQEVGKDNILSLEDVNLPTLKQQSTIVAKESQTETQIAIDEMDCVTTMQRPLGNNNILRKLKRQYGMEYTTPSFEDVSPHSSTSTPPTPTPTTNVSNSLASICHQYIQDKHLLAALETRRRQTLLMHRYLSTIDSYHSSDESSSMEDKTKVVHTEVLPTTPLNETLTECAQKVVHHASETCSSTSTSCCCSSPTATPPPVDRAQSLHDHHTSQNTTFCDCDEDCDDSISVNINNHFTISYNFINAILFSDQLSRDNASQTGESSLMTSVEEDIILTDDNDEKDILVDKINKSIKRRKNTTITTTTTTTTTNKITTTPLSVKTKISNNESSAVSFKRNSNISSTPSTRRRRLSKNHKQKSTSAVKMANTTQSTACLDSGIGCSNNNVAQLVAKGPVKKKYIAVVEGDDGDDFSDDGDEASSLHCIPGFKAEKLDCKKSNNALDMPKTPNAALEALNTRTICKQAKGSINQESDEVNMWKGENRYGPEYFLDDGTKSLQSSSPFRATVKKQIQTEQEPEPEPLSQTSALTPQVQEREIVLNAHKSIPAPQMEGSLCTISQQSTQSGKTTTSEDSDAISILECKHHNTTTIAREQTSATVSEEPSTILNFNRQESTPPVFTTATKGATPTAFKFLQPKRKLLNPSQILSFEEDEPQQNVTSSFIDKPAIETEVVHAMPSVKALAKAFLMTSSSIHHSSDRIWPRKGKAKGLIEPTKPLETPKNEVNKSEEDIATNSDLPPLETHSSCVQKQSENIKGQNSPLSAENTPVTLTTTAITDNSSPLPARQGVLKSNIAFFENLKFNHTTKTTQWEDPRIQYKQQQALNASANARVTNKSAAGENILASNNLGPLPEGWEQALTETGEVYFINHIDRTTSWNDPRIPLFIQKELKAKTEMSWVNATEIDKDSDVFKQKAGQKSLNKHNISLHMDPFLSGDNHARQESSDSGLSLSSNSFSVNTDFITHMDTSMDCISENGSIIDQLNNDNIYMLNDVLNSPTNKPDNLEWYKLN